jgi:hypothetical protein
MRKARGEVDYTHSRTRMHDARGFKKRPYIGLVDARAFVAIA